MDPLDRNNTKEECNNTHENDDCKQLIHDTVVNAYQTEWQRTHDIENKATGIVGFVGIIFSLTVATLSTLLASDNDSIRGKIFSGSIFSYLTIFIILALMILSIYFGIKALNVKQWWFPFADKFIDYCNNNRITKNIILGKITNDVAKGTKINSDKNDKIADYLEWSYKLFLLSTIILALYIMCLIYTCR
jgi:hypothetical protein